MNDAEWMIESDGKGEFYVTHLTCNKTGHMDSPLFVDSLRIYMERHRCV